MNQGCMEEGAARKSKTISIVGLGKSVENQGFCSVQTWILRKSGLQDYMIEFAEIFWVFRRALRKCEPSNWQLPNAQVASDRPENCFNFQPSTALIFWGKLVRGLKKKITDSFVVSTSFNLRVFVRCQMTKGKTHGLQSTNGSLTSRSLNFRNVGDFCPTKVTWC